MRIYSIIPATILLALVFWLAPTPATAGDCGGENQILCGGECTWYLKWGVVPWCYREASYCSRGYEPVTRYFADPEGFVVPYERCTASAAPPPPPLPVCDAACQAQKINTALGNPEDASLNRTISISRAQAGIPDSIKISLDIGGEGHQRSGSRCNLSSSVVNINPAKTIPGGGAIPNLVLAYGQKLPFVNAFADQISAESVPFDAWWGEEMARVVKPGGKLAVCGPAGDSGFNEGVAQLSAHGLTPTATNNFALDQREVVFNVSPFYSYAQVAIPEPAKCSLSATPTRAMTVAAVGTGACVLDMAVFYTSTAEAEAKAAGSDIQTVISQRVAAMNTALTNSGLAVQVRAVHAGPTSYDEIQDGKDMQRVMEVMSGAYPAAVANTAATQRIHDARKAAGADLVSIFVTRSAQVGSVPSSACGIGSDILVKNQGYSVLRWSCLSNSDTALAHEAGHNLGLHHDRYADGKPASYDPTGYNYGYVSLAGSGFWTIMGYSKQCVDNKKNLCSLIRYYSSPGNSYVGVATGAANADNKRAITENAPMVARYYPTAPELSPAPAKVDFEGVLTGTAATPMTVVIYNTSGSSLAVSSVSVDNSAAGFRVGTTTCTASVGAARACDVQLNFSPTTVGKFNATLSVVFAGGKTVSVPVKGEGMANVPELVVSANRSDIEGADPIDFGNAITASTTTLSLTFANNGPGALVVSRVELSGSTDFSLTTESDPDLQPCAGFPNTFTVPAHGWCRAGVSLRPGGVGSRAATMTIRSNDPTTPTRAISLTGWGVSDEL